MLSTLFWQHILSSYWGLVWFFFPHLIQHSNNALPVCAFPCIAFLHKWTHSSLAFSVQLPAARMEESGQKREGIAAFWNREVWRVVLVCTVWTKESEQTYSSWADYAYTLLSHYVLRTGFASINLSWFGRKKLTQEQQARAIKIKNSEK